MQWYVLKTWAGREDELAALVNEALPEGSGCESFVLRHERIWRRERQNILHVEPLFPGYVFVTCREKGTFFYEENSGNALPAAEPFHWFSQFPKLHRLLEEGEFSVYPMAPAEAEFLDRLQDSDHIVRLSYVSTDGAGFVYDVTGPLRGCRQRIVRYGFKKRFAIIRLQLLGEETTAALGIVLREDIEEPLQAIG